MKLTRSAALLKTLVQRGGFASADLARAMRCEPDHLESCIAGDVMLTLPQQLCLALFVIDRAPKLARRGHSLHAQVSAAMRFEARETRVHMEPPGRWT